jgi:hypothetical protein
MTGLSIKAVDGSVVKAEHAIDVDVISPNKAEVNPYLSLRNTASARESFHTPLTTSIGCVS